MKKIITTIAILLGLTLCVMAQNGGGLFQRGTMPDEAYYEDYNTRDGGLILPGGHGLPDDADAPLGGGALLLIGFGAAYAMKKRREK